MESDGIWHGSGKAMENSWKVTVMEFGIGLEKQWKIHGKSL